MVFLAAAVGLATLAFLWCLARPGPTRSHRPGARPRIVVRLGPGRHVLATRGGAARPAATVVTARLDTPGPASVTERRPP